MKDSLEKDLVELMGIEEKKPKFPLAKLITGLAAVGILSVGILSLPQVRSSLDERKIRDYKTRYDTASFLLEEGKLDLADEEIERLIDDASEDKKAIELGLLPDYGKLDEKIDTTISSKVSTELSKISLKKDYKERKNNLDELMAFCERVQFGDKESRVREIEQAHLKGIKAEQDLVAKLLDKFDSAKQSANRKYYAEADAAIESLLSQLTSNSLVYDNKAFLTENSELNRKLRENGISSLNSFSDVIQEYRKTQLGTHTARISEISAELQQASQNYDKYIIGRDIANLIRVDNELSSVLQSSLVSDYPELKPKFQKQYVAVVLVLRTFARVKQREYETKISDLGKRISRNDLSADELKSLRNELASVKSEMEKYTRNPVPLFSERYL
ncbi:MAG: hypothetical protein ABIH72_02585 [archaeon]